MSPNININPGKEVINITIKLIFTISISHKMLIANKRPLAYTRWVVMKIVFPEIVFIREMFVNIYWP